MPNELKQRKKTQPQKPSDDDTSTTKDKDEVQKVKTGAGNFSGENKTSSCMDFRSILCLLSLTACGALSW